MKICFLLQRNFAYIGHAMAVALNTRYGVTDFCGYVYSRESLSFLQSQKEITYTKLLLDEDLHTGYKNETVDRAYLKRLEKEYGTPNIWPVIESDRLIRNGQYLREYPHDKPKYSHEVMLRILQAQAKAITRFFEEEKPDCIILSVIANVGSLLLYHIAKKKNIKVFFIFTARIYNRYAITEDYTTLTYIEKAFADLRQKKVAYPHCRRRAEQFLIEFRKVPTPPTNLDSPLATPVTTRKQFKFLAPRNLWVSVAWLTHTFVSYFLDPHKADYIVIKPWHHLWDRIKRKTRVLIGFSDLYDTVDPKENFAFFPLHFEPEMSLSLFNPVYNDQLWVIKQIAKSLPIDFRLYVKEHPAMFGYRPRSFYKELKKMPTVKLLDPSLMSFEITRQAQLIFTLTGTAGWEAMLFKKPVIIFGDVFYEKLPMVKKCEAMKDLPYIIRDQLEHFRYDEDALIDMITAIYKESAEVDLMQIWAVDGSSEMEKKKKAVLPIADLIASKLNLKPTEPDA